MTALLRSITFFTAVSLIIFVGLHAVVPHEHPHAGGAESSEVPPFSHSENKVFALVFALLILPSLFEHTSRKLTLIAEAYFILLLEEVRVAEAIPIRWNDALRKGRIHSRAD